MRFGKRDLNHDHRGKMEFTGLHIPSRILKDSIAWLVRRPPGRLRKDKPSDVPRRLHSIGTFLLALAIVMGVLAIAATVSAQADDGSEVLRRAIWTIAGFFLVVSLFFFVIGRTVRRRQDRASRKKDS